VSFADIDLAAATFAEILRTDAWRAPEFASKQTVT